MLELLAATLEPAAETRTNAERHLEQLYTNDAFPLSLISIASHTSVDLALRQAALLSLKTFVLRTWSSSLDEFQGLVTINDATKDQVRHTLLALATSGDQERKVVSASSYVVSKIASVDFPDQWPSLLPTLLQLIPQSHENQLHGVLVVLGNLVEDGFDEEQFGKSAIELVRCIYDIATDERKKLTSRALAISIFRACFETMEVMYQTDKASVKQFMQEASDAWTPFFIKVPETFIFLGNLRKSHKNGHDLGDPGPIICAIWQLLGRNLRFEFPLHGNAAHQSLDIVEFFDD